MALIDSATKAYFDLVAALESAVVADRAVAAAQSHGIGAQHLFDAGQVPHADVLRAETELANERVQSLSAHNAVALAQIALDDVPNVPLGEVHQPTDPLDAAVPDVALPTLLTSATTNRGDVAAARAAIDAALFALKEARTGRAPHVDIVVADGNVQPAVVPGYRNQFLVGLNAVGRCSTTVRFPGTSLPRRPASTKRSSPSNSCRTMPNCKSASPFSI